MDDPFRPDSYYGLSKAFGEILTRQFFDLHGLSSICIRIGAFRDELPLSSQVYEVLSISAEDLAQLTIKALQTNIKFGVYFGLSNNKKACLDISQTKRDLGYLPQDSF